MDNAQKTDIAGIVAARVHVADWRIKGTRPIREKGDLNRLLQEFKFPSSIILNKQKHREDHRPGQGVQIHQGDYPEGKAHILSSKTRLKAAD